MILDSTGDKITVTTDAAGDIEIQESHVDLSGTTITPGSDALASITTATTVDVVPAPGASTQRIIDHLSFFNNHASQTVLVTVEMTDGTHTAVVGQATLLTKESLVFDNTGKWTHYDSNRSEYPAALPVATQTEQEAGTSLVKAVTPGMQHYHPSAVKCWGKANGAGTTLSASYNVTSISDTGTGRLGVNIATDFSSADYAITYGTERTVTALTATGVEGDNIRNASQAAGSFEIESYDHTATTFVAQDPAAYHWQCCGDQ
jgi:hypothetical protein